MLRVVTTLLMIAVLAPATAFGSVGFRCNGDGRIHASRCCPAKVQAENAEAPCSTIRKLECCELIRTIPEATQARLETERQRFLDEQAQAATLDEQPASLLEVEWTASWVASGRSHEPGGPPLFLRLRHLLI
jgi:hypothetical protein